MADKDGMERKVYVLPAELVERIRAYQNAQGIASEVEAARRLLDAALQMRDSVRDILNKLKSKYEDEKDLRVLARDTLTSHALVTEIMLNDNDVTFRIRGGDYGMIDKAGKIYSGNEVTYLSEIIPSPNLPRPKLQATAAKATAEGDLDDEIPF